MVILWKGCGNGRLIDVLVLVIFICILGISSVDLLISISQHSWLIYRVFLYCRDQWGVYKHILITGLGANTVCQAECIVPITDHWSWVRPWSDFVTELITYSCCTSWHLQCFRICRNIAWKRYPFCSHFCNKDYRL
jgi:hypothetical protein